MTLTTAPAPLDVQLPDGCGFEVAAARPELAVVPAGQEAERRWANLNRSVTECLTRTR